MGLHSVFRIAAYSFLRDSGALSRVRAVRMIGRLVLAGLELKAAERGLTPAERIAHAELAARLERQRRDADRRERIAAATSH